MKAKIIFCALLITVLLSALASGEVPKLINYQGKITTPQGALISDTFSIVVSIYSDSTGGTTLWTETQTPVKVEYGVFSVLLGSVNPIPAIVFDGNTRYLGLKVGSDNEMTPRKAIVSVGYAYHSMTADTAYFTMPDADWTISGANVHHLNGNVGIGTTNPGERLELNGSIKLSPDNHIFIGSSVIPGYSALNLKGVGDDGVIESGGHGKIYLRADNSLVFQTWDTAWADRMVVQKYGNVGIGTTSPQAPLHVLVSGTTLTGEATPTNEGPVFQNSAPGNNSGIDIIGPNTGGCAISFGDTDDRDVAGIFYSHLDNSMGFQTNDVYQMRITNNGNVGIGTDNPAYKLDVEGYVQAYGYYTGDIVFQKDKEKLWRMFEDEDGLYLENLRTGKIYRFILQEVKKE